jgi:hypothetical protein
MAPLGRYGFATDDAHLLAGATQRALDEQASTLARRGTVAPIAFGNVDARWGTLVHVDPSNGPLRVRLPTITPPDVGRSIIIVNGTDIANAVTIASESASINGASSVTVARPYWVREAVAMTERLYVLVSVLDGATTTANLESWNYIADAPPVGAPAPVEVWRFDGGASQLTGRIAGTALTLSSGTLQTAMIGALRGIVCTSNVHYLTAGAAAALQIVGDLTVEVLISEKVAQASASSILACGDPAAGIGVGTSQCAYALRYDTSSYELLGMGHSGSFVTIPRSFATTTANLNYFAFTRLGAVGTAYQNGVRCSQATMGARPTAPGCATSQFRLQRAQNDAASVNETSWFSIRITGAAYTAQNVADAWRQVRS